MSSFGLILPPDMDPPVAVCCVCGEKFKKSQQRDYEGHVNRCTDRHMDELLKLSHSHVSPDLFGPESGDFEKRRWAKDNKKALISGRMKL